MAEPVEYNALSCLLANALTHPGATAAAILDHGITSESWETPAAREVFEACRKKVLSGSQFFWRLADLSEIAAKASEWASNQRSSDTLGVALGRLSERARMRMLTLHHKLLGDALKAQNGSEVGAIIRAMAEIGNPGSGDDVSSQALADAVEAASNSPRRRLCRTGIELLDKETGGFPANLVVVGAQPGVGKSGFLAALVLAMAAQGKKVGVLSLEDEGEWLMRRMLARHMRSPISEILTAYGKPYVLERLSAAVREFKGNFSDAFFVKTMQRPTVSALIGAAEKMVLHRKVDMILMDHMGEVTLDRGHRHDLEVDALASSCRSLSQRAGIPFVALAHTRRNEEGGKPKLTDFAFSAGLERKSRLAMILTREELGNMLTVHVLKNTEGPSGHSFPLQFDKSSGMVCI